jgi:hypothetical protein
MRKIGYSILLLTLLISFGRSLEQGVDKTFDASILVNSVHKSKLTAELMDLLLDKKQLSELIQVLQSIKKKNEVLVESEAKQLMENRIEIEKVESELKEYKAPSQEFFIKMQKLFQEFKSQRSKVANENICEVYQWVCKHFLPWQITAVCRSEEMSRLSSRDDQEQKLKLYAGQILLDPTTLEILQHLQLKVASR